MKKNIVFMLSGSIACYKACASISALVQKGYSVSSVATPNALRFIGRATLEGLTGQPVFSDIYENGRAMDHIHLARTADLMVVCPATANTITRLALGLADDPISTLVLANNFKTPLWIAPAMNTEMFNHPATQDAFEKLKSWGARILTSPAGNLACGEYGTGRLIEPDTLFAEIELYFAPRTRS